MLRAENRHSRATNKRPFPLGVWVFQQVTLGVKSFALCNDSCQVGNKALSLCLCPDQLKI